LSRLGLSGVQLVISDAHEGLRSALSQVFAGATWQRCKVHFLRNVASAVPKLHAPAVLTVVKSIFLQTTRETARDAVNYALTALEPRFPSVAAKLRTAEHDVLAYLDFPVDHWRSISSTNAIERVNAELDRRAKVVGIFPNTESLLRLFTAVLQDQHDEWQDGRRHFSQQSMARLLHPDGPPLLTNPLTEGLVA
jgi:transposase-like protein